MNPKVFWRFHRWYWIRAFNIKFNNTSQEYVRRTALYGEPSNAYWIWKEEQIRRANSQKQFNDAVCLTVFDFYRFNSRYVEMMRQQYPFWDYLLKE